VEGTELVANVRGNIVHAPATGIPEHFS
jgi:hypothetical protein